MKPCGICGTSNNDDNQFCIGCGQKLEPNQPAQVVPTTPNPPIPPQASPVPLGHQQPNPIPSAQMPSAEMPSAEMPYTYGQPPNAFGFTPAMPNVSRFQNVREVASSNLMLILVILWFVQIALSFLTAVFGSAADAALLNEIGFNTSEIVRINSLVTGISASSSIPALIPTILIGIGMLMTYRMASNSAAPLRTSGITMIRVVSIIQFVFVCLVIAAALIIGILLLGGGASGIVGEIFSEFGDFGYGGFDFLDEAVGFIGAIILIAALIVGGLMIGFFIVLLKFLGSVLQTIRTGIPQEKCASALSVIFYILGAFSALGVFGSLTELALSPAFGLLSLAVSGFSAVIYFLLGTLINKYKRAVYSYN